MNDITIKDIEEEIKEVMELFNTSYLFDGNLNYNALLDYIKEVGIEHFYSLMEERIKPELDEYEMLVGYGYMCLEDFPYYILYIAITRAKIKALHNNFEKAIINQIDLIALNLFDTLKEDCKRYIAIPRMKGMLKEFYKNVALEN